MDGAHKHKVDLVLTSSYLTSSTAAPIRMWCIECISPFQMSRITCYTLRVTHSRRTRYRTVYNLALQVAGQRRTIRPTRGWRSVSALSDTHCDLLVLPPTYNQVLPLLRYVSRSVDFHILFQLRGYLLRCSEGIQKADEERHFLPSPCNPDKILRLFQCYHRHSSDPSTAL